MSALNDLYAEIAACQKCGLAKGRTHTVPGEGPKNATLMFIGEAPGFHEDRQGRPFVGAAGEFLEELLSSIGLRREEVYICNVIKCRPPNNRDPLFTEIEACRPYLDRQIELINPRVIITLGRFSMARFFPQSNISKIHGQPKKVGNRVIIPVYHPAAALHQSRYKADIERDFLKIPQIIQDLDAVDESTAQEKPEQLSLF
ncbi:MAG: uracil-DNA glycosylase [Chloroflexi bacterium]|nr:uracil-DNA glycosylase [Chloroflexota bacterium]